MVTRPISRVSLVCPKDAGAMDLLVDELANELLTMGVHVYRQTATQGPDRGARVDVALWWQGADGRVPAIDRALASARVHALVVDGPVRDTLPLLAADAVLVVHEALAAPIAKRLRDAGASEPPVHVARIPLSPSLARDVAKARHHVAGKTVVLIDVVDGFERDIERVMIQLALVTAPHVRVLHVPHDERSRARARDLATRHGVDAFLTSGPAALAHATPAADLMVGRPLVRDLLVAASHKTAVSWLDGEADVDKAVVTALVERRALSRCDGVLHLAAFLERRLADRGGIEAEGTLARSALVGDARAFLDILGGITESAGSARAHATWEPVGPSSSEQKGEAARVDAKAPVDEVERAARIEEQLRRLKERLREGAS